MKKIAMTAACFVLGGMLTVSMAGECGKSKKSCGDKEGCDKKEATSIVDTTVFCGGEKKGCDKKEATSIVDATVFCGGEKKGCDKGETSEI